MLPPFVNVCNVTAPLAPVIAPDAVNALALLELLLILIALPPLTVPVFTVPVAFTVRLLLPNVIVCPLAVYVPPVCSDNVLKL
jgi:hypothetical protein